MRDTITKETEAANGIVIERSEDSAYLRAAVRPFGDNVEIKVRAEKAAVVGPLAGDKWPIVIWPSLGEVSVDTARQFHAALGKAIEEADRLKPEAAEKGAAV